jgi:tetratricopeptide (TPR) repeat protein
MCSVRRTLPVLVLLILAGAGAALTVRTAAHDSRYRRLIARGEAALRDDQMPAALEAYSGAIAVRPDSMLAHLRRGEAYLRRGDLDAAGRDFQRAAVLDGMATRPLEELGDVRFLQRRFQRAGEIYEQALRLDDGAARISYKVALARYRSGRPAAALAPLESALRIDDQMSDAYYLEGLCLRDQRQTADARRAFEKAVALSPGFIAAREELADLYASIGRRADQLEQLQVLAGLDREHVERQIAIGQAHAQWAADPRETAAKRASHADLAVLTLGAALERTPDQPQVYGALGHVWLDLATASGDPAVLTKALQAFEHSTTSVSASSEVLTLYGRALLQAGRKEVGERILQQATERYPVDPAAYLSYSDAAERQNHFEAAREALVHYNALAPDDQGFAQRAMRIAQLSLKIGDRSTALLWTNRGLDKAPDSPELLALRQQLP